MSGMQGLPFRGVQKQGILKFKMSLTRGTIQLANTSNAPTHNAYNFGIPKIDYIVAAYFNDSLFYQLPHRRL